MPRPFALIVERHGTDICLAELVVQRRITLVMTAIEPNAELRSAPNRLLVLDHLRRIAADAERRLHNVRIAEQTEPSTARNLPPGVRPWKRIRPFGADSYLREGRLVSGGLLLRLWRSLRMNMIDETRG
jgi:hypothetical protein